MFLTFPFSPSDTSLLLAPDSPSCVKTWRPQNAALEKSQCGEELKRLTSIVASRAIITTITAKLISVSSHT